MEVFPFIRFQRIIPFFGKMIPARQDPCECPVAKRMEPQNRIFMIIDVFFFVHDYHLRAGRECVRHSDFRRPLWSVLAVNDPT